MSSRSPLGLDHTDSESLDRDLAAVSQHAVHELVRQHAATHPHAVALDGVSYAELDAWAGRVGRLLHEHGVLRDRPVAVRLPAGAEHVAALLGVLKVGCHLLLLDSQASTSRCKQLLSEIETTGLIVASEPDCEALADWYHQERSGPVLRVPSSADESVDPLMGFNDEIDPDSPAYIVYTSGTTGRPKRVAQSHRALAQMTLWMASEFRMGAGRRTAQWAATHYDASLCEIFGTLVAGGTLCPVPSEIRFDAGKVIEWIATERIHLFQTVPSFGRELLNAANSAPSRPNLSRLEHLLFAGEPLSGQLVSSFSALVPGVRLINLYGPTETILATWLDVSGAVEEMMPVGRAIPGRTLLVLDPNDQPCEQDTIGEIVVCSTLLTCGYIGENPASGPRFDNVLLEEGAGQKRVPCYRTGDLGRWRPDGTLEFHGRRDRQVKLNGIRVELVEIETALNKHPSVVDCTVVPQIGPNGLVQELVAYVVPASESGSARVWQAHLRAELGSSIAVSTFVEISVLPRNAGGKVDTESLPAPQRRQTKRKRSRTESFRKWAASTPSEETPKE